MRSFILVSLVVATAVTAHAQQQVPTRTLAKPDVEYAEPFSQLTGLRELRDGRLVASDMRDKTLQLVDIAATRATPIGRSGAGPGEWLLPARVFPFPGDSSLVFDIGNTRYLMVGPDGKPGRVFNPFGDFQDGGGFVTRGDAPGRGGGGRGAGRVGGPSIVSLSFPRTVDARGRIYSQGTAIVFDASKGTITSADSAPILRYDLASKKTDTVAYVNLAKNTVSGTARSSGGGDERMVRIGGAAPYAPADDWTVLGDGRVVIARVADYHLEIVQPGGRRVVGQPVRFTPVRIGDGEKQEWRDAQKSGTRVAMTFGNDGGGTSRSVSTPAAGPANEPASWPANKPPFAGGGNMTSSTWAAPNGDVWVMRHRAAKDKTPTADVFDAQARLIGRVAFPERTRLVGFGARGVYLVRVDDDDLQYLQRYVWKWTGQ